MFKLMDKKIRAILHSKRLIIGTYDIRKVDLKILNACTSTDWGNWKISAQFENQASDVCKA